MREEILEETMNSPFEEGKEYKFQIQKISDSVLTNKSHYRTWEFISFIDGEATKPIRMNLFPWQAFSLVESMGFVKIDKKIKVDYDKIEGEFLFAKVVTEKYTKDGKEKSALKLSDFRKDDDEEIPF